MIINKRSPDFEFASVLREIYKARNRNDSKRKRNENINENDCNRIKVNVRMKTPISSNDSSSTDKRRRVQGGVVCDLKKSFSSSSNNKEKDVRNVSVDIHKRNYSQCMLYSNEIKVDELIMLNERWIDIIRELNKENINDNYNALNHACFEWWLFYFNSSLIGTFTSLFLLSNRTIINSACNIEIFYIMLLYDITNQPNIFRGLKIIFKSVFHALKTNFNVILSRAINTYKNIIPQNDYVYITQLQNILSSYHNTKSPKIPTNINLISISEPSAINLINQNCTLVTDYFKIIINQYTKQKKNSLISLFNTLSIIPYSKLNDFFFTNIATSLNTNRSLISPSLIKTYKNPIIASPYITQPSYKRYTLVLDLDETLICFKFKSKNENSGTLYFRPYLFEFLNSMKTFYELITFTAATKEYADPIIRAIEGKEKIFDYKLYREHAVIVGKDFVKDLSRIGRDLSRIMIVDNMPMNFRLNEENGIAIVPFYYQEKEDRALLELGGILRKIAVEKGDDIRDHLVKYKKEITLKVSCNSGVYM